MHRSLRALVVGGTVVMLAALLLKRWVEQLSVDAAGAVRQLLMGG